MSQQQVMVGPRHPLSLTFLLHIALESPLAVQGLLAAHKLPFLDMNNTSLILVRLLSALSAACCLGAFLVFPLPAFNRQPLDWAEYLPGKRAVAIILMLYHMIATGIFWQAPRFIPYSLGAFAEQAKITPELLWAGLHAFIAFGFVLWWQNTLGMIQPVKRE